MEKFIESFEEKSTTHKIIITLLVALGLLVLTGGLYILTTPSSKKTDQETLVASPSQNPPSSSPPSAAAQNPISPSPNTNWSAYQGDGYQINYPPDVSIQPGVINGGGSALILKGKSGSTEYTIEIQVTSSSITPIQNIYEIFKGLGYKEEQTNIDSAIARKFSGSIGSLGLWETAIVFENRGKVYKIQSEYTSPGKNNLIEQTVSRTISTFKLL